MCVGSLLSGLVSTLLHRTCGEVIFHSADSVSSLCTGLGSTGQHMTCGDLILQSADSVSTLCTGFYWVAYHLCRPHTPLCRQYQHSPHWHLLESICSLTTSCSILLTFPQLS